jgi:hypothetical protein
MAIKQNFWWYVPIVLVMLLGYGLGGGLVFGLYFLNWLPSLTEKIARLVLELFGMGMLGSTMYCTKYWAIDIDDVVTHPEFLPHKFDWFGYAVTIIGGGITGTVLYMAFSSGTLMALSNPTNVGIRTVSSFFISFCGGLFHFKVKDWFESAINRILKKNR